ncbi:MAG TPA: hypothetical protein VM889_03180 [Candidatus Thermoplasmatota archaeon]|nr:hypothetical protein [Candidatus Thermoplasmatota archaeon]
MPWRAATGALPYPIEPIRHRYVTPFGGFTYELQPWQVGLVRPALATTALAAGARVLVSAVLDGRAKPLFARRWYEIVPLDPRATPDAAGRGAHGEAVFSSFELDEADTAVGDVEEGSPVVLNAAENLLYGRDRRPVDPNP